MQFQTMAQLCALVGVLAGSSLVDGAEPKRPGFEARLLASHNNARKAAGAPPLVWSELLAADAKRWAMQLASSGRFDHAPQTPGKPDQGENLWMGTSAAYAPEEMVGSWVEEKQYYHRGRFPNVSTTGNWQDVGHYTQLIWFNTTAVGCGVATGGGDDYLVCRYSPPGNWIGQDPQSALLLPKQKDKKIRK